VTGSFFSSPHLLLLPPPSSPSSTFSFVSRSHLTRARWNGYNADSHAQVMQRFEALEGQRREERQKTIEEKLSAGVQKHHGMCNRMPRALNSRVMDFGIAFHYVHMPCCFMARLPHTALRRSCC
jgi:hypothetical protein